ncbi:nucleotide sugar dehydrogenase [Cohnella sp.]|uniref:nucleotide sugar dehydrogenase n=1 Tax=Cohnella sp. TaxID=1883426 RepID=UPI00356831C5
MTSKQSERDAKPDPRRVQIVGLGYVGLPLAVLFSEQGFIVAGVDVDERKIEFLKQGKSYVKDLTNEALQSALTSGSFVPTSRYDDSARAGTIILCVPTPLSDRSTPDMSYLHAAVTETGKRLRPGQLIVLESSTYPGTTSEEMVPILERESGLKAGIDFNVGYSPERIDPGNTKFSVRDIPKVVSGLTPACLRRTESLYAQAFGQTVRVSSPEVAEMTKLLENTYRLINISFMNEMAMLCDEMGIDLWEAIDAAKTKSFGYAAFYPGPGVGGHCIPVDPLYLQWRASQFGRKSAFIELAERQNRAMADYLMRKTQGMLKDGLRHAVIYGVAYKKDVGDVRESAAVQLIERLMEEGIHFAYHDPIVPFIRIRNREITSSELSDDLLREADCIFIMANHTGMPVQRIVSNARFIVDTRNATSGMNGGHIYRFGSGNIGLDQKNPLD